MINHSHSKKLLIRHEALDKSRQFLKGKRIPPGEWPVLFKTIVILDEVHCFWQSAGQNGKDYSFRFAVKRQLLKFRKFPSDDA